MSRITLHESNDWKLKFDEQDVRGFDALDAQGNRVGRVSQMIVDTDDERVDAVVLEDGTEYPARDLSIGDGVVYLTAPLDKEVAASVTVFEDGHAVRREHVGELESDAYAEAFREHCRTAYGGDAYDRYAPAYTYGYESGQHDRYRNRPYADAQTDLQRDYATRHPNRTYDDDQGAIEYGYTYAQQGARQPSS